MDFIFEDDVDEVGSDIEAYCPKCKSDTSHTIITKYEDEIRRVQCSPCGDVHSYRKPRGEVEDEAPEPVAAKKRAAAKKPGWKEAMDRAGPKGVANARPYSIRDTYADGDLVSHPKFGVGYVTEITENKVEITFEDERRLLVHNRPDLAAQMPAIASTPAPREHGKKGRGKKKEPEVQKAVAPAKPVAAPPPPQVKAAKAAKAVPEKVRPTAQKAKGKVVKPEKPQKPKKPEKKPVQGKAQRAKAAAAKKGAAKAKGKVSKPVKQKKKAKAR